MVGKEKYYIDRLGLHHFDDVIVYCAGDQLICWPPDTPRSIFETRDVPSKRFAVDQNLTPQEAFSGMIKVVGLSPDAGRVLFAHAILGLSRSAYIGSSIIPSATLELVDKHGTFKSTYSSFVTQLYDRHIAIEPITRMNSSTRFIEEILHEYSECTAVIDDIHPAKTQGISKCNESTAEEIIRRIGDNAGRGRMEGNATVQNNPRGNAVFTGEYTIFEGSTAARSLVISFTTPIDGKRLHECQQQPLLVSTFYRNFIQWYVEHYHDIVESLGERLTKHRELDMGISPRLWETQFCLQTAYMMFLQYSLDSGFISTETARDEYNDFSSLLTLLIKTQNARITPDKTEESQDVDYFKLVCTLYKSKRLHLAKSKERFEPEKHDGFFHDDLLCIRSENLLKRVQVIAPHATLSILRDALMARNAMKLDGEGKNLKFAITRSGKGEKTSQMRFYGIYIKKIK